MEAEVEVREAAGLREQEATRVSAEATEAGGGRGKKFTPY
jgi:hypothetical protein